MSALEHQLRIEDALGTATAAIAEAERRLFVADLHLGELDDMRAAAAVGDADPVAVEEYAARYELQRDEATAELERERATVAALEQRMQAARHEEKIEAFDELQAELDEAQAAVLEAASGLSGVFAAAVRAAEVMLAVRARADAVKVDAERAARAAGVDVKLVDEPAWRPAGWKALVTLLQGHPHPAQTGLVGTFAYVDGGPRTPNADAVESELARPKASGRPDVRSLAVASLTFPWLDEHEPLANVVARLLTLKGVPLDFVDEVLVEREALVEANERRIAEHNARVHAEMMNG